MRDQFNQWRGKMKTGSTHVGGGYAVTPYWPQ